MKKSSENKTLKKSNHNVETPTPPHVMDPSALPVKEDHKSKSRPVEKKVEKKKVPSEEKLAPNEEL
jgi:hypothetical protein